MALLCLRLFTGFMLLLSLQPGLRAPLKAHLGLNIYFEIDEDVESRDCLADGGGDMDF